MREICNNMTYEKKGKKRKDINNNSERLSHIVLESSRKGLCMLQISVRDPMTHLSNQTDRLSLIHHMEYNEKGFGLACFMHFISDIIMGELLALDFARDYNIYE